MSELTLSQIRSDGPAAPGDGLQSDRDRLQFLLSSTSAVLYSCSVTPPYGATFIGENVKRVLGYEPHEFTNDSNFWADHLHPEDAPLVLSNLPGLFQQGEQVQRYRFRHQDGTYRWMRDDLHLVRDARGQPREILGCWIDITQSKRVEEELRKQADLLDLTPDAIIVRGMDDRITFWNRGAHELYGWRPEEAFGQVPQVLLKTSFPMHRSEIDRQLRRQGHWEGELIHTTRAGRIVTVASRWSLQLDKAGNNLAILETNTDITEKKQVDAALFQAQAQLEQRVQERTAELAAANQALLESQERFRQVAENIPEVFWLSNPSMSQVIYVSPSYEQIWGRSCQELYEHPQAWLQAVHPDDQALLRDTLSKPHAEHGFEMEYRVLRPDGSIRWVLDRGFPVRDRAGVLYRFAGIARDVTERKELEREVLGISDRERRRIGQDLHDDLCQQLVGLEFLSQALQQQLAGRPEADQAKEIARLIRGAIDHTRRLARGLAPVDLDAEGLVPALRGLARRASKYFGLKCSFVCPHTVRVPGPSVSTHLYRIAQEAVTNSVKHGQAHQIQIRLATTPSGVCLSVHDDGCGLAKDWRQRRGLGLRIMQYRASTIGGSCVIRPEPKGGTTLVCTAPLGHPDKTVPPDS